MSRVVPCLLALVPLFQEEGAELLEESRVDGSRVEREVVRDVHGEPVDHGDYRSWHANGQLAEEGRHREGLRVGEWRTWHPNGALASDGIYRRGLRTDKWVYLAEDGRRLGESGTFRAHFEEHPGGEPRVAGEFRFKFRHGTWRWWRPDGTLACEGSYHNDRREGTWTWTWEDGAPKLVGTYERDVRHGPWRFHHPGGQVDPELLSGTYEEGERVGPLPDDPAGKAADPASLPDPEPHPLLTDPDRRLVEELVRRFADGEEADGAREALVEWEVAVLPPVLRRLQRLDLADEAGALAAYRLVYVLLHQATGGHLFPWRGGNAPADAAANRLAVLRWHTLWRLTRGRLAYWESVRESAPRDAPRILFEPPLAELDDPLRDPSAQPPVEAAADDHEAAHDEHARLVALHGGAGTEEALARALAWLAENQAEDGSWDCEAHGGYPQQDLGVSGLAVLALRGGGSSLRGGLHRDALVAAVEWMRAQQDPRTGLFGEPSHREFLYGHAIATLALLEAVRGADDPRLEAQVQLALHTIQRARNPEGAWRYDMPPIGDNDTSVTSWMLSALGIARRYGYDVDAAALEGGLAWIEGVTDLDTGRIGYSEHGSFSSRTMTNKEYPPELGEAMTAAGLWCRLLLGQDPAEHEAIELNATLLLGALPRWEPEELGNDLYYWYHGTNALFQLGDPAWREWNVALKEALLEGQNDQGAAAGSWDPIGPWGYVGGRVYSTALAALCLEVYYRHPRFSDD